MKYFFKAFAGIILFIFHIIYHSIVYVIFFLWSFKPISFRNHLIRITELNDCVYSDTNSLRQDSFLQIFKRWLRCDYYL